MVVDPVHIIITYRRALHTGKQLFMGRKKKTNYQTVLALSDKGISFRRKKKRSRAKKSAGSADLS